MEMQSTTYCFKPNRFSSISIQPCLNTNISPNFLKWRNRETQSERTNPHRVSLQFHSHPKLRINASSKSDKTQIAYVNSSKLDKPEPFGGKSGSISFYGVTHQVIEEGKLVSSPFKDGKGSLLWLLAPIAFISSLLLPQFFFGNAIEAFIKDDILAEIATSFTSEAMFYFGFAAFLLVTDYVQKPYLEYSPKRWGLITGLNGYLSSAFFTMGFKVVAPLFAAYATWPALGLASVVAVAPFLIGCAVQFAFEVNLEKRGSSCWPLVPIIFEVYRLYQLTNAAHFVERMMMSMRGSALSPQTMEKSGALVGLLASFQVLGVVCLWSLMSFLLRLFPSRPVVEKY